ncbi:MAG: HAD family hydrolase [Spirochaetales bacterium]|nr:HAD family hydrolase [Spirochaetales bacterium]
MAIKGLGFDIDGTLYNNLYMYLCTIPTFIKRPILAYHFGKNRAAIRAVRPISNFRRTQAEMVAKEMGIPETKARAMLQKLIYEDWVNRFKIIKPLKGLSDGLVELRRSGYKLGALSDFPVQKKLEFLGLEDWDCSFTSEETGYLKPHPEPFIELSKRLCLPPEEILYVGNSYSKDVEGASKVGMKTAYYSKCKKGGPAADITFRSYPELFDYIKNECGVKNSSS